MRVLLTLAVVALGSREASFRALQQTSLHEGLNTMVLRARKWLQDHKDPDQAGMDELKSTNPDAFAIVQALLTKKSLGLLNPKQPALGGFSGTPAATQESAPQASSDVEVPVAALETESPHTQKNWLNWKPTNGLDDDAMVSNVLGAVAELKTGGSQAAVEPPAPQQHKAEMVSVKSVVESKQVSPSNNNRYMAEIGQETASPPTHTTPLVVAPAPKASMSQKNSYLSSLGVPAAAMIKVKDQAETSNPLASFKFDDSDAANVGGSEKEEIKPFVAPEVTVPVAVAPQPPRTPEVAVVATSSHTVNNWLNWHPHDDDIAEEVRQAPAAPQQHKAEMVAIKSAGDSKPQHQPASPGKGNRYLADMGQGTPNAPEKPKPTKLNALASFSWNDAAPKPKVALAAAVSKPSMSQKNSYLGSLGVPAASTAKTQAQAEPSDPLTSFSWNDNDSTKAEGIKTPVAAVATGSYSGWLNWKPHDDDIAQAVREAPSAPKPHKAEMVAVKSTVKLAAESEKSINQYLIMQRFMAAQNQGNAAAAASKTSASDSDGNHYMADLGLGPAAAPEIQAPIKKDALASFNWNSASKSGSDSTQEAAAPYNPLSSPLGGYLRAKVA